MSVSGYTLEPINTISFETFYELIQTNKDYIKKGFAGTVKRAQSKADTEVLFNEWVVEEKQGKAFNFFIKDRSKNKSIGLVNIKNIDDQAKKCEIGYFINKNYTGQGLITKFTSEVVTYCFETLQMNKVFIRVAPYNVASQKIALKNGFIQEGILRQEYCGYGNQLEDIVYFGLLKDEYLKQQQ